MGKSVHKCEFGIERAGCAVSGRAGSVGGGKARQPSREAARPPQRAIRVMPISEGEHLLQSDPSNLGQYLNDAANLLISLSRRFANFLGGFTF